MSRELAPWPPSKEDEATAVPQTQLQSGEIDPFVKEVIGATNGSLYQHLVGMLTEYPIPALRLPAGRWPELSGNRLQLGPVVSGGRAIRLPGSRG